MYRAPWLFPLLLLAAGCASQPPAAGEPVAADKVSVHESVASVRGEVKIIKRYWVDSWQSAFLVPTYASRADALEAFKRHAASLGGNAVINFGCYRKYSETSLGCNGTVARVAN
jgi:hypothetical protein